MPSYVEIIHYFATQKMFVSNKGDWGLSEIPQEFQEFKPDQNLQWTNYLDQMLILFMIDDSSKHLEGWTFDLDLSTRLYEQASEFRLCCAVPKDINSYSNNLELKDPYYPLTLDELRSCLGELYKPRLSYMSLHPYSSDANVEKVFK